MTFRIKGKTWLIFALFFYLAFLLYTYFIFNLIYGNAIPEQIPGYPTKYITEFVLLSLFFLCSLSGIWLLKTPRLKKISIGLTVYAFLLWFWHIAAYAELWITQRTPFQQYIDNSYPYILKKTISPNHKLLAFLIQVPAFRDDYSQVEVQAVKGGFSHIILYIKGDACAENEPIVWKDNEHLIEMFQTYDIYRPTETLSCE